MCRHHFTTTGPSTAADPTHIKNLVDEKFIAIALPHNVCTELAKAATLRVRARDITESGGPCLLKPTFATPSPLTQLPLPTGMSRVSCNLLRTPTVTSGRYQPLSASS